MAGGQERELRGRIRSVQSTKKITKAFELIAASQIARAQARIAANRPYRAGMARMVVEAALGDPATARKLLAVPADPSRVSLLAIVGDRGLSGAYNSSVLRATERKAGELGRQSVDVRLTTVGKKAQGYFRFRGQPLERSFLGMSDRPTFADARAVAGAVAGPFMDGEVEQVVLISTRFYSAGRQAVEVEQLLPLPDPTVEAELAGISEEELQAGVQPPEGIPDATRAARRGAAPLARTRTGGYTEFEPEVGKLLTVLAPRAVESEIFSALLEASASEHTARQRAMAAASENADELIRTYTRTMNRARQDSITTEIMEIVSGAEALRSAKGA